MQRCSVCDARLNESELCPRCGTDLSRIVRCERLAELWLAVALQALQLGRADVAVAALARSLSFRRTPEAGLVRDYLLRQRYRALYDSLGRQQWAEAANILSGLRKLQGGNEALRRFEEMIEYCSVLAQAPGKYPEI